MPGLDLPIAVRAAQAGRCDKNPLIVWTTTIQLFALMLLSVMSIVIREKLSDFELN